MVRAALDRVWWSRVESDRQSVSSNRLVTPRRSTFHRLHARLLVRLRLPTWARNGVCVFASERTASRCRDVVVRIHFVPTLLALEVFFMELGLMCEPAIHPRTALRGVIWADLLHGNTLFRGFLLDVLEQASERPDVVPLRL